MCWMIRLTALSALTAALALAGGSLAQSAQPAQASPPRPLIEFEVVARQFEFSPSVLEVTKGDRVRILVRSEDKLHGFAIPRLRIDRLLPSNGKVATIEFDAKDAGTFEIICSESCGTGHKGMRGSLVITSREKDQQ
jgi:cytochrome c oxidase subunit 2